MKKFKLLDNPYAVCRWAVVEKLPSLFPEPRVTVWAEFKRRKHAMAFKKDLDK